MTTYSPRGAQDLVEGQAIPAAHVNEKQIRFTEAGACHFPVADKDLTAPPGSCAAGANYIIAGSPTGLWSGKAAQIATASGTNAANGWLYHVPVEGFTAYAQDENKQYLFDGSAWVEAAGVASVSITTSETLTAGQIVNLHSSTGAKVRKANATDTTKPAHAFVLAGATSGNPATLFFPGQIVTGLSSLTPGATYYLDISGGAITTTAPSSSGNGVQEVGFAIDATRLLFNPQSMIEI